MNPQDHIDELLELAAKSPCSRDKRGAIVVRDGEVIGRGYNAPVGGSCTDDVCHKIVRRDGWAEPVVRSCGGHVEHAEAMAMRRAEYTLGASGVFGPKYYPMLNGCELIHMDTEVLTYTDERQQDRYERGPKPSRRRGCPSCAVLASGFGVDAVWLLHEDGWQRWPMAAYAKLAGVV